MSELEIFPNLNSKIFPISRGNIVISQEVSKLSLIFWIMLMKKGNSPSLLYCYTVTYFTFDIKIESIKRVLRVIFKTI